MSSSPFHPQPGTSDISQFQWPPAPARPNVEDDRHKQVFAFLKRNGAPDYRIFESRMFAPGKEPSPLFPYLVWRGLFPAGFMPSPVNTYNTYEENVALFDDLQRFEEQPAPVMVNSYTLTLQSPNVALTELEVRFKFGNPFADEEVFQYVKAKAEGSVVTPPRQPAAIPVGKPIEHGDGTSYYCDPLWEPEAPAGTQFTTGLPGDPIFTLVVRYYPFGKMRWWKWTGQVAKAA